MAPWQRPTRAFVAVPAVPLWWVLMLAASVRALYAWGAWRAWGDASVFYGLDSESYVAPARELLAHGTFTVNGLPELQRTPGYSVMLLPGLWLGHLELTTVTLQILLATLTVLGVYRLASRFSDDSRVAVAAAALYAFEPLSIVFSTEIRPETLFTATVVWALVLVVDYLRAPARAAWRVIAGTAILAASAYVRPVAYYLPFALVVVLAGLMVVHRAWRELPRLAAAAALAFAVVLPWQVRNRTSGFDGFAAVEAINLYFYNAGAIRAAQTGTPVGQMRVDMGYSNQERYLELHPEQRQWRHGERFEFMRTEGLRIIQENPGVYARLHLSGMMRVLLDPGATDMLKPYRLYPREGGMLDRIATEGMVAGLRHLFAQQPLAAAVFIGTGLALVLVYGLALRGTIVGVRARDPAIAVLVICIAYFVTVAGGPAAVGRFRHPAMPLICVLAAIGLLSLGSERDRASATAAEPRRSAPR